MIGHLVTETNRYTNRRKVPGWEDTTPEEVKAFLGVSLGVTIWMGLRQLPDLYGYCCVVCSWNQAGTSKAEL